MDFKRIEIYTSPTVARIIGFLLGYGIRFVQLPFFFYVFFLLFYLSGTLFHSHLVQAKLITALLWPLVLFRYPDTATYTDFSPIVAIVAFWLLTFHIFWFILGKLFHRTWLFRPENNTRLTNYFFLFSFALSVISTIFATNVSDKGLMVIFLVVICLVGWVTFWASKAFFKMSDAMIYQDPKTTVFIK